MPFGQLRKNLLSGNMYCGLPIMMALLVTCPLDDEIVTIVLDDCPSDIGQIQRILFQRVFSAPGTRNTMTFANASVEGTWDTLFAASDSTKVQISPLIAAPNTEPGEAIEYGSGNEVPDGIPVVVGREYTGFDAQLLRQHAKTIGSLKGLEGETKLGVYLVSEHGYIWGETTNATTPADFMPIPIVGFFVGDRKIGGFQEPDRNQIKWKFPPNWSDRIVPAIPSGFDPLSDFTNP